MAEKINSEPKPQQSAEATEIEVTFSKTKRRTYRYSDALRGRILLIVASVIICLAYIALPGLTAWAIGKSLGIGRIVSFAVIAAGIPYILPSLPAVFSRRAIVAGLAKEDKG